MFISVREGGKTIADITNRTLGKTGYILFILFVLFLAVLVTSAFLGLTATALTSLVPAKTVGIVRAIHNCPSNYNRPKDRTGDG